MRYFRYLLKHKWFVFLASFKVGLSLWRAIIHDWSKFLPSELPQYNRQFFGDGRNMEEYAIAWLHHQNLNAHHPEYWITRSDVRHMCTSAVGGCLPMPKTYVKEMLADWLGAGKAKTGSWDIQDWVDRELPKKHFNAKTRERVHQLLRELGIKV